MHIGEITASYKGTQSAPTILQFKTSIELYIFCVFM